MPNDHDRLYLLCLQVSHVHTCLLIGWSPEHMSSIFIRAFLLVGLLSTRIPISSLPSYWSGFCLQVSHFHPCLHIGRALVQKSPICIPAFLLVGLVSTSLPFSSLPLYRWGSCPQVFHVHPNLLNI